MTRVAFLAFFLAVLVSSGRAFARERLAVFIAVADEPELAENLSEVTIAKLAESGDFELVGMRELESTSHDVPTVHEAGLTACLAIPTCLAEVGQRARVERAVLGSVRREAAAYHVELALIHTDSFQTDKTQAQRTPAELAALIGAVQALVAELVKPPARMEETVPAAVAPAGLAFEGADGNTKTASSSRTAAIPTERNRDTDARRGAPWQTVAGVTAAGLAVIAFSAGTLLRIAADSPPSGATRVERLADIEHRTNQEKAANALFITGGVFSAAAVVAFVWP